MQDSQNRRILSHLQDGHRITGLQALRLFGCSHLPRRIKDLKEAGHDLSFRWVHVDTPYGEKRVKEWRLDCA